MQSIESGAVCQSRVESPRDTHRMTANEWRRSRTINESWSNKKGGMVETQGIDSFRVVTSKIIRCHRWIIFLDWRSLIILMQATLSGWFFELVGLGSCCVGGCVWCFTFVETNVDTGHLGLFAWLYRSILIRLGWILLNIDFLLLLHWFMLIHPWISLRYIFLLNRNYVLNLLIYFGRQILLQPLKL